MRTVVAAALVLTGAAAARAQPTDTPAPPAAATPAAATPAPTTPEQFEASRAEYSAGAAAYEHGDYDVALVHFQAAYKLAPSPELWFNIGRCHERLGRWTAAASAYESYLAGKPTVDDAAQIREHISDLRLRAAEAARLAQPPPAPAPPPPAPPSRSLRAPAIALAAVTVALAAGGVGTYFSEWSDYQSRRAACQSQCTAAALDGLRSRVQTAEVAAAALWAVAGAALVADVTLWILDARQHRHAERQTATAGAGGLAVHF